MLTDVIMRAFELIDLSTQTIAKLDAAMRKHALSLIIKEAKKKAFDGWDSWRYELLEKAVCLCDEKLAAKLEKLLDIFLEDMIICRNIKGRKIQFYVINYIDI